MLFIPTVTMWTLGIYEDIKVLQLTSPSIPAMTILHSFLDPATASQAPYGLLLLFVFLSSAPPCSSFPAESQENRGGEGCLTGTELEEDGPRAAQFAEVARAVSSICDRVRSCVNLKHARRGRFFPCQERAPSQELQPAT